jgi:hypothetical protein
MVDSPLGPVQTRRFTVDRRLSIVNGPPGPLQMVDFTINHRPSTVDRKTFSWPNKHNLWFTIDS